ncbi:class I SAM-dependent methyltransferase [Cellulophaga sp. F20128]|uniref:class I SAM-dependent methyltransferase n=1 Tax=Cellulophaga sp. F20128 TaxID=2926413 RepID=UPI001FF33A71|nr:class I SAM-dependent methyltransferase [Cellulophaga sp. F20128]MCK0158520.1 class I SAM-dependent methyltransferase [Cellulophaga sp. F20128]
MNYYKETFETWNKIAKVYQDKFMDLDLYNDTYDHFSTLIGKPNASVLEIGCGPGNITKKLLTKNPNLKLLGIDVSENMITLAKQNNPTAEFRQMDCRDLGNLQNKFDAIVCGFCIPYLSETDCATLIQNCNKLLHRDGVLYLSFVAGNYKQSGFISGSSGDRVYFYYHPLQSIEKALSINSFTIKENSTKTYLKSDSTTETHTILLSKKNN